MWWFVLSAAVAAPPTGVDPEDLNRWIAGSKALLAGPEGCWVLSGTVDLTLSGYIPASRWTRPERRDHVYRGSFTGRIDGGVWQEFGYDLDSEEDQDLDMPLYPMTGTIDPSIVKRTDEVGESTLSVDGGSEEAANTLRRVLDAIDPMTETSYAEWSEEKRGVRLLEDVPLSEKGSDVVTVETFFPEGGRATSLDATFPRRLKVGDDLVKVTVFDGQMHLRAQQTGDLVLPALESLSVGLGALGFTGAWEQKLVYQKATRCSGAAAAPGTAAPTP